MLDIDFKSGKVIYNEFNIDFSKPLKLQIYNLNQDLLQVEYKNNYILDVGWSPDFDVTAWRPLPSDRSVRRRCR